MFRVLWNLINENYRSPGRRRTRKTVKKKKKTKEIFCLIWTTVMRNLLLLHGRYVTTIIRKYNNNFIFIGRYPLPELSRELIWPRVLCRSPKDLKYSVIGHEMALLSSPLGSIAVEAWLLWRHGETAADRLRSLANRVGCVCRFVFLVLVCCRVFLCFCAFIASPLPLGASRSIIRKFRRQPCKRSRPGDNKN